MTRAYDLKPTLPKPNSSVTPAPDQDAADYQICGCGVAGETFNLIIAPGDFTLVDTVHCDEKVSLRGTTSERNGVMLKVRSARNKEGYISSGFVCWAGTSTRALQPQPALQQSEPHNGESQQTHSSNSPGSSLTLKILQTEQVPYTVQYGGGRVDTDCSISGTVSTSGTATTLGNFTEWSANSFPYLTMSCSTSQIPPMGWRHVLSAMLAVASDGNAYVIACDAAWRWSKCRGLRPGDIFEAQWAKGGLSIDYNTEKGKREEATYTVLVSKSLR